MLLVIEYEGKRNERKEMAIVKPRINDYHNLSFSQESVDFAIPFLDSDIPLFLDPFLLWKSPSQMDKSLHLTIVQSFNRLGEMFLSGNRDVAIEILNSLSECDEVGLGSSVSKQGRRIGQEKAEEILSLFSSHDKIKSKGIIHLEIIQLLVNGVSKDRISDFASNFIKSFLIDYTIEQCKKLQIPLAKTEVKNIFDLEKNTLIDEEVELPINPITKKPILFVPKRYLRYSPWMSLDDYYSASYIPNIDDLIKSGKLDKVKILLYNRKNFGLVENYIKIKQDSERECYNDPLFKQIPLSSVKSKFNQIKKLPIGKTDNADKKYEDLIVQIFASMLFPQLDFADDQVRTIENIHIRDLIFYNNRGIDFLQDIYNTYGSKQIVFELKNVKELTTENVNQVARYLPEHFGSFGIIVTRNPIKKSVEKNIIDLWSAHRKCILVLDDTNVETMVDLYKSRDRRPLDVIKLKFIEFTRTLPN